MLNFYLITAGLLLLSLLCWFLSIRMKAGKLDEEQQALAREQVNIHQLRLRELAVKHSHDELDDKEYEASVIDLKRQLLHDLSSVNASSATVGKPLALFVPGSVFLIVFVATFYYANGQFSQFQQWEQTIDMLPELGKRAVLNEGDMLTTKELQQFALGLRTKLHHDDSDGVAWLLLGRVTQALNDLDAAELAFEKAYLLEPEKVSVLLNYSQVLLMRGDQPSIKKTAGLLREVLRQEPENIDGLLMVGYIAEQLGDSAKAMEAWQVLTVKLPQDDPRLVFVQDKLQTLKNPVAATPNSAEMVAQMAKVTVHLTIDESLVDKMPAGAILFVYAKAAKGPPMPAAVVKLDTFELPLTVELTDANAMLENFNLSSLGELVIRTRVSVDQNIEISAGELQGQSQVFSLSDTTEVSVVINQVL